MDAIATVLNTLIAALGENPMVSLCLIMIAILMAGIVHLTRQLNGERDRYDALRTAMQADINELNTQFAKLNADYGATNGANADNLLKMSDALVRVTEALAKD